MTEKVNSVCISGIGICTPFGKRAEDFWVAGTSEGSVKSPINLFDVDGFPIQKANWVNDISRIELPSRKLAKMLPRRDHLLIGAAYSAWKDANLLTQGLVPPEKIACYVGSPSTQLDDLSPYFKAVLSCVSEDRSTFDSSKFGREGLANVNPLVSLKVLMNGGLAHICQLLDIQGSNANFMDFEISGDKALAAGFHAIQHGEADRCLVGAVSAPMDPFTLSDLYHRGIIGPDDFPAEGAIFFVLEKLHLQNEKIGAKKYFSIESINETVTTERSKNEDIERFSQKFGNYFEARGLFLALWNFLNANQHQEKGFSVENYNFAGQSVLSRFSLTESRSKIFSDNFHHRFF